MTSGTVVDLRVKRRERARRLLDLDWVRPDDPAYAPGFEALRGAVAEETGARRRHLYAVPDPV